MRRISFFLRLALTVEVLSCVAVGSATVSPAQAATCQYSGIHHTLDGYETSQNSGRMGALGWIVTRQGDWCTGSKDHFWNAWVMVASGNRNALDYAQAGYIKGSGWLGGYVRSFAQSYDNSYPVDPQTFLGGQINYGDNIGYKAYMDWTTGSAKMAVGPFLVLTSFFNPYQTWSGSRSVWKAESDDPKTMIPGTSGSKTGFTGLEELQYLGSWTSSIPAPYFNENGNPADWGRDPFVYCVDGHRCFNVWHW